MTVLTNEKARASLLRAVEHSRNPYEAEQIRVRLARLEATISVLSGGAQLP